MYLSVSVVQCEFRHGLVKRNHKLHNLDSPLLIGDTVKEVS